MVTESDDFSVPSDAPPGPIGPERLLNGAVEAWVKDRAGKYHVLSGIRFDNHFTAVLVAIMLRLDYTPKRELLAFQERLVRTGTIIPALVDVVKYHVSAELLADLDAAIEVAESGTEVEELVLHDENGQPIPESAVYVTKDGGMVYQEHAPKPLDTDQDRGKDWGSW